MGMQNFKDEQRVAGIEKALMALADQLDKKFIEQEESIQKLTSEVKLLLEVIKAKK